MAQLITVVETPPVAQAVTVAPNKPLEKALIINEVTGDRIPVQFNPEQYVLNKDVNYAQAGVPGLNAPILQFVHGNLQTLELELLVDTYETHMDGSRQLNQSGDDVRVLTSKLTGLMTVNPKTHAPPVLIFSWGQSLSFTCVLARVSQRFIMFLPDGTPVRARLQVSFHEYTNAILEAKEQKNETADYSKLHVVVQGETLSGIAAKVYENAAMWRPIALRNGIDDPGALTIGQRLLVPQLPFRDPETGEVMQ